jgi:hypothetical protein
MISPDGDLPGCRLTKKARFMGKSPLLTEPEIVFSGFKLCHFAVEKGGDKTLLWQQVKWSGMPG